MSKVILLALLGLGLLASNAEALIYQQMANAGSTGTTVNTLTITTGAPSTAVIATTSTTTGVIGITAAGAGTSGNAIIAIEGEQSCVFDNANVAGNWAVISTTVAGNCHDSGTANTSAPPAGTVGFSISTNAGGAGTYTIFIAAGSNPRLQGALLNAAQSWTAPQRTNTETPAISTATFTPVFSTAQNHRIVLVHASCPCTLANPAALVAGQSGVFEIVQSATGTDSIGTWGSEYQYVGGTSTIVLSTGANAADYIPYYVDSSGSFIVLGGIIKGPAH